MTLVRTKLAAIAEPLEAPPEAPSRPSFPALPRTRRPVVAPVPAAGGNLRRCTFRRLTLVSVEMRRQALPRYQVDCLYDGRETVRPLGDLGSARAFCDACTNMGIFRPDED